MAKPSDFFIGLMDFFAVLLPGAILTFLFWDLVREPVSHALPPLSKEAGWIAFLIASYVLGHVLHHAGSLLDKTYDSWYVKRRRKKRKDKWLGHTLELMQRSLGADAEDANAYSWAGSYVRLHSDAGTREIERLGAESKFFRSLVLVLLFATVTIALKHGGWIPVGTFVLAAFSYWRFLRRRWDSSQTTYEYFILINQDRERKAAER